MVLDQLRLKNIQNIFFYTTKIRKGKGKEKWKSINKVWFVFKLLKISFLCIYLDDSFLSWYK